MAKSKGKSKPIIRPTMVVLKGLQAAGELAPFPYIKGAAALALTVLEIVDAASSNRKDIDEFAERIGNTISTLKNVADRHSRAGDGDLTDLQELCGDFRRCLQEIIHDLREIQKANTDRNKIMQYLMITDVRDKIRTFVQRADTLQRDFDTGIITETRAIVSSIRRDTKSGLTSIKASIDSLHLATEDYTSVEQRLYVAVRNDLGPLISSARSDILRAIKDNRGIYKGVIRDITLGDINLGHQTTSFVENSATHTGGNFFEHYCTINGDTKIARVYRRHHAYDEEDIKMFHSDLQKMLHVRHENITQLFGVCRATQFPALIFHNRSSHNRTVYEHCSSLDRFQLITFGMQLMKDLRSAYYHVKFVTGTSVPYNYIPTAVYVDNNGRILLDELREDPNAPHYHWTRLGCELLGRDPPVIIPKCLKNAPLGFDYLHYCSHVLHDLLRCFIPVHDIMDEHVMASLLTKVQELTASGRQLRKDDLCRLYNSFRGVTLGTVFTTEERFNLGSIIGLQKLMANHPRMPRRFSQIQLLASIPLPQRHITNWHMTIHGRGFLPLYSQCRHIQLPSNGVIFSCSIATIHQRLLMRPIYQTNTQQCLETETESCDSAQIDTSISEEIYSWFAQAVRIPREHRHIGMEHLGVDWYSALLFDVRFALEIDQVHVSENDVDLPQMYAHYTSEVNNDFAAPSPTDDNFGNFYLTVRPPRDMFTPGHESTSYKPEFLWSLTPNFDETLSSDILANIFHIMIRETAVYGACVLERRDYKLLRGLHEDCGFDRKRDGEDISRFFEFPPMTVYPCQPYRGYRLAEWPSCMTCFGPHAPTVNNFGVDWKTPPPSPLSSRSSSPLLDESVPIHHISCEPESEVSADLLYRNYRYELLCSIVALVMIFLISRNSTNQT